MTIQPRKGFRWGWTAFLVIAALVLLGIFFDLRATKVVRGEETLPAAGGSTVGLGASPLGTGPFSAAAALIARKPTEEAIYRQPTGVAILSVLMLCLGVLAMAFWEIAGNKWATGVARLSTFWGCILVLVFTWGLISTLAEARKELKLDAQHFELGNQKVRFGDLTEIRWVLQSGRKSKRYDLTCIKKSGGQEVVSLDSAWEKAVHEILDRAKQKGVRVTQEDPPSGFRWKIGIRL
jgi:hypothetical protein